MKQVKSAIQSDNSLLIVLVPNSSKGNLKQQQAQAIQ